MVINWGKTLSGAMFVMSIVASIAYFCAKDYLKGTYWLGSSILIASLTFEGEYGTRICI